MIDVEEFGSEYIQAFIKAGGTYNNPGTYLWLNARTPYQQAGQLGLLQGSASRRALNFAFGWGIIKGCEDCVFTAR